MSEIQRSSRGTERAPRHVLAPRNDDRSRYANDDYDEDEYVGEEPRADWSAQVATLKRHQVTLGAVALIIASLILKGAFLTHYYFRQDDFQVFDAALRSKLSWSYLTHVDSGHFFPGLYAIAWVLARVALYNWTIGAGLILVLLAGASLAAWRCLRTLLGDRPAILIPLVIFLFASLTFSDDSWWINAVEAIPLQIAIFMSLDAHVRYVRTRRIWHALAAAGWLLFGMIFNEKAALVPLLLFAITAGFLIRRRGLLSAVRVAAVELWRAWLIYVGLLAVYAGVFLAAFSGSNGRRPAAPNSFQAVWTFVWDQFFRTFVPGILGGPWQWWHPGHAADAYSKPPEGLAWLALLVFVALVVATVLTRRNAWRGWIIIVGWLVLADMAPVVVGRLMIHGWAGILGIATRYIADATVVFAIVIGLVFWPVAGRLGETAGDSTPRREFFGGQWKKVAGALIIVFAVGSLWSVYQLKAGTTVVSRAYIANATKALAQAPSGTVIIDQQLPPNVMLRTFGHYSDTSVVLGPLSHRGAQIQWANLPSGNLGNLMIFGTDGRLYTAAISGQTSAPVPVFGDCIGPKKPILVIPLPVSPALGPSVRVLRIGYLAKSGSAGTTAMVTYGSFVGHIPILAGAYNAYMAVTGSPPSLEVQAQVGSGAFCFEKAVAGHFVPFGPAIPRFSAG